ncbi:glycosyltransferase family 2 protein [Nocardia carnea]|uniref:glycosyltransferase family 2 protein n=1 Tax=Nocardia carnea TaxID=37328 RepID=UPI002456C9DD|nr:glycosyltransferase family 2 protein [Nocardia carnea]
MSPAEDSLATGHPPRRSAGAAELTAAGAARRAAGTGARTTVVIATRNRAPELARTLTELRALRPRPEIVVLDNASEDDTAAVAGTFAGVTVIRLPRNLGAAARNLGVARARTPYVAFSDDDSWWAGDALPRAERLFDACPRLGLVAGRTLVGAGDRDDPVNELMATSPLGHSADLPGPSVLGFLACASIVRREAYLGAGGFSPLLHFGAEEKLLALDLAAAGWQLCYVADIRAHHHPSAQRPPPGWRRRAEQRNNALITWMRRPLRRCVAETGRLLGRAVRDPRTVPVVAGVLGRLPRALAQRRRLPTEVERCAGTLELAEERK